MTTTRTHTGVGARDIYDMITRFEGRWVFLSNFHPITIEHQGIKYPTVEHYYVAMKCNNEQHFSGVMYTPVDFREMIARMPYPGSVKKLGQKMRVRKDWDEKKVGFMRWGLEEKFKDEFLKEMLISTGDMYIIEGNLWHDNFWGSCTCEKCGDKGENRLGKMLMEIRESAIGKPKRDSLGDFLFPKL